AMDLTASEAVTVTGTGGRELIAASTPITGVPWAVIVDISVAQALSDVDDVLGWLLLVGGVLLGAAALTAWGLSGRLTGSIEELGAAAVAISGGDYSRRVTVSTRDELGVLADSF